MLEKLKRIHKYNGRSGKTGSDLHETPKMDIIQKAVKREGKADIRNPLSTLRSKTSTRFRVKSAAESV